MGMEERPDSTCRLGNKNTKHKKQAICCSKKKAHRKFTVEAQILPQTKLQATWQTSTAHSTLAAEIQGICMLLGGGCETPVWG